MRVSVVIPMCNAATCILNCLKALDAQEQKPFEIIIVDNNSTDSSKTVVQNAISAMPGLRIIICSEKKVGPGAARNTGVRMAQGDIIAFTDVDCLPHQDWIKNIAFAFEQDSGLDAIGGVDWPTSPAPTVMGKFLSAFWLPYDQMQQSQVACKEDLFNTKFLVTFNCAFKRAFFMKVNGFDESFKTGEDIDLSIRSIQQGGKLVAWNQQIRVCHRQDIHLKGLLKREFCYAKGLTQNIERHFKGNIIIMSSHQYYQWPSRFGLTVVLMSNAVKVMILMALLIPITIFSFKLSMLALGVTVLFYMVKIRRQVKKNGAYLSFPETVLAFSYYLSREIVELLSRLFWSFKYKVVCL